MTTVDSPATAGVETFDSTNPATGELVGRFPAHDEAAVRAAVDRARAAAAPPTSPPTWSNAISAARSPRRRGR